MTQRIALITGGARGIGLAVAERLVRDGFGVAILDLPVRQPETVALDLANRTGAQALGLPCDITERTQVAASLDAIHRRFGRLDVLVNNAGICPGVNILEMDDATFRRTLDVNLVDTAMAQGWWQKPGGKAFLDQRVPLKRPATPEDIARAVALLTSADAEYVTGASLTVDGGLTAYSG